jgi:hypothetical protein
MLYLVRIRGPTNLQAIPASSLGCRGRERTATVAFVHGPRVSSVAARCFSTPVSGGNAFPPEICYRGGKVCTNYRGNLLLSQNGTIWVITR